MLHTQILFLDKNAASFFAEGKIMRIAVCDDLKNDLQTISFLLDDYMLDRKLSIEYELFDSYEELEGRTDEFDFFLLDYDMPGMDGLEFSKLLYERYGEKKRIVFITAYDTVIYRAFEVRAWRYIVKPIKKEILYEALDSFLGDNKAYATITVRHDGQTKVININDIYSIHSEGKTVSFTMEGNVRINCHDTMDNIESKLNGFGFFRTHRKNIVNLKKVESFMNNYVALKNKCIVEMSPRRYKEFRIEYLKNGE